MNRNVLIACATARRKLVSVYDIDEFPGVCASAVSHWHRRELRIPRNCIGRDHRVGNATELDSLRQRAYVIFADPWKQSDSLRVTHVRR